MRPGDLTLVGFGRHILETLTNVDGRLIRSFRCLIVRPGELTLAYLEGSRKLYTSPLQTFFIANVLFFAAQSLTGGRVFSTTLKSHLENQPWSPWAQNLVANRLAAKHISLMEFTRVFDQAVALNAKTFIILMVLPFAYLPALVYLKKRIPFVGHLVFSLHLYAFLLLLFCLTLSVAGVSQYLGGPGIESEVLDRWLSIFEIVVCAIYLYVASGKVYGPQGSMRSIKVIPLVVAVAAIVLGYRFIIFLFTLYTV